MVKDEPFKRHEQKGQQIFVDSRIIRNFARTNYNFNARPVRTTKIEWTDKTWNPITGCTKKSMGCAHCYVEVMDCSMWLEWVVNIKQQVERHGAAFFFKQWGIWGSDGVKRNKHANGKLLLGEVIQQMPFNYGYIH